MTAFSDNYDWALILSLGSHEQDDISEKGVGSDNGVGLPVVRMSSEHYNSHRSFVHFGNFFLSNHCFEGDDRSSDVASTAYRNMPCPYDHNLLTVLI